MCLATARGFTITPAATPSTTTTISAVASPTATFIPHRISTIVGGGYAIDSSPGTSAALQFSIGVAIDTKGNVVICEAGAHRVRVWTAATAFISTVVGTGAAGFSGDGGPGTAAMLNTPTGVATDTAGNVYIADTVNQRVRMWSATTHIITTIAGSGNPGYSGDGAPGTAAKLSGPTGVAIDATGNVFIADYYNNRIRKLSSSTGNISTVVGTGPTGPAGSFGGDGGPGFAAALCAPVGVTADAFGNVYIADSGNNRIRMWVAATQIVTTIVGAGPGGYSGDGGPGTNTMLYYPTGVAVGSNGDVIIADYNNSRVRTWFASDHTVITIAGNGTTGFGGDGGAATAAMLLLPGGVTVDAAGTVYIADAGNGRIRVRSSVAVITPSASSTSTPSPSTTPYCWPSLYRTLLRTDLVGTLVGSAVDPAAIVMAPTDGDCRQACCDAPECTAYSFASANVGRLAVPGAQCFLFVNVTALVPNNLMTSGALLSTYS